MPRFAETNLFTIPDIEFVECIDYTTLNANELLIYGARIESETLIHKAIKGGADVNIRTTTGQSALLYITRQLRYDYPSFGLVELLIGFGADVNVKDESGRTPLFWIKRAITKYEYSLKSIKETLEFIISKGATDEGEIVPVEASPRIGLSENIMESQPTDMGSLPVIEIPIEDIQGGIMSVIDLLVRTDRIKSKGMAKQFIKDGSIAINGIEVILLDTEISRWDFLNIKLKLSVGKKNHYAVKLV